MTESSLLYNELYGKIGSRGDLTSLPKQAIPIKKKNDKWKKACMDRLEEIGKRQKVKNLPFYEYYNMVDGDLAYTDYEETPSILKHVSDLRDRADLPSYVKHYDFIGRIGWYLSGKWNDTKAKFRVDFFDEIGQNEYDRELNNRLFKFARQYFEIEKQTKLLKAGVEFKSSFESEEQKQAYLQQLEQVKQSLSLPPDIKTAMSTQWKPKAAEWAQHTIENDRSRFNSDKRERQFFIDRYLTGRFFNHYRIGYDYYKPERWDPRETFFSEDADIEYPQDGEYVGNIQEMSPSKVLDKFGHLMKELDQKRIANAFASDSTNSHNVGGKPDIEKQVGVIDTDDDVIVPDDNYFDRMSTIALENALDRPFSEISFYGKDGELQTQSSFTPDYDFDTSASFESSKYIRNDIDVREDTLTVTQAYWRSFERVALIYRETETGLLTTDWVTDDLMEEFLTENNIKTLKELSITEYKNRLIQGTLEVNSIVFLYVPRVYKGIKISGEGTVLNKDIYLDIGPTDFQIKGDSNLYDVKLPVSGIITSSVAKNLRPYQVEYNYQMNLMHSLTEKEVGIFWLFDITLLPSDFDGLGDSKEIISNVVDMARDIGMVPVDMSKQNMRDRVGQQFNSMMAQDISFVPQIKQKMELAEYYKRLALESIGLNAQSLGTPSEYSTAEGIKLGQSNIRSQIEHIFDSMDEAILKDMELNLAVAQYCQTNNKDISIGFMQSTETQILVREVFSDENFSLRKFGVRPVADSQKRKNLETFKRFMLESNTFSNDAYDFAKVISSDSMKVVTDELRKAQLERIEQENNRQQQQVQMQQKQIEAEKELDASNKQFELEKQRRELENNIKVAAIREIGQLNDSNYKNGSEDSIKDLSKDFLKEDRENRKLEIDKNYKDEKNKIEKLKIKLGLEELDIKREQNDIKRKAIEAKRFGDIINKN